MYIQIFCLMFMLLSLNSFAFAKNEILNLNFNKTNQLFINSNDGSIIHLISEDNKIKFIDSNGIKVTTEINLEDSNIISSVLLSMPFPGLQSEISVIDNKAYVGNTFNHKLYILDLNTKVLLKELTIVSGSSILSNPSTKKVYVQSAEFNSDTQKYDLALIILDANSDEVIKKIPIDFIGELQLDGNNIYLTGGETLASLYVSDSDGDGIESCKSDIENKPTLLQKIIVVDSVTDEIKEEVPISLENTCEHVGSPFINNDKAYYPLGRSKIAIYDLKTRALESKMLLKNARIKFLQANKEKNILYATVQNKKRDIVKYQIIPFDLFTFEQINGDYKFPLVLYGAQFIEKLNSFYYFSSISSGDQLKKLTFNKFSGIE